MRSLKLLYLALFALASQAAQPVADSLWNLGSLSKTPVIFPATNQSSVPGVRSLFFEGATFNGKPTRVFAWYGAPTNAVGGKKVPAMVLIHGGGGTAFDAWVKLWLSRGYAAIAMDLCGSVPVGTYGQWQRHEQGGPPGWGGFDQIDQPQRDQWTYHAVADTLLAHSLIRSFPEVDSARIGVTGISWGGYLTCIVSSVDTRFKFAAPVYGCGFLGDNSTWLGTFEKMGAEKSSRWLGLWDPSHPLKRTSMPVLWVNGSNDFAYPMDSWQKSYRATKGTDTLCLRVRMPHGHGGAGENPAEIHAFAEHLFNGGVPLAKVTKQGRDGAKVWATFTSPSTIKKAELNYTKDGGKWQQRKWETAPAEIDGSSNKASATLPAGTTVYYLNLVDERGLVVSAEHEEIREAK